MNPRDLVEISPNRGLKQYRCIDKKSGRASYTSHS